MIEVLLIISIVITYILMIREQDKEIKAYREAKERYERLYRDTAKRMRNSEYIWYIRWK